MSTQKPSQAKVATNATNGVTVARMVNDPKLDSMRGDLMDPKAVEHTRSELVNFEERLRQLNSMNNLFDDDPTDDSPISFGGSDNLIAAAPTAPAVTAPADVGLVPLGDLQVSGIDDTDFTDDDNLLASFGTDSGLVDLGTAPMDVAHASTADVVVGEQAARDIEGPTIEVLPIEVLPEVEEPQASVGSVLEDIEAVSLEGLDALDMLANEDSAIEVAKIHLPVLASQVNPPVQGAQDAVVSNAEQPEHADSIIPDASAEMGGTSANGFVIPFSLLDEMEEIEEIERAEANHYEQLQEALESPTISDAAEIPFTLAGDDEIAINEAKSQQAIDDLASHEQIDAFIDVDPDLMDHEMQEVLPAVTDNQDPLAGFDFSQNYDQTVADIPTDDGDISTLGSQNNSFDAPRPSWAISADDAFAIPGSAFNDDEAIKSVREAEALLPDDDEPQVWQVEAAPAAQHGNPEPIEESWKFTDAETDAAMSENIAGSYQNETVDVQGWADMPAMDLPEVNDGVHILNANLNISEDSSSGWADDIVVDNGEGGQVGNEPSPAQPVPAQPAAETPVKSGKLKSRIMFGTAIAAILGLTAFGGLSIVGSMSGPVTTTGIADGGIVAPANDDAGNVTDMTGVVPNTPIASEPPIVEQVTDQPVQLAAPVAETQTDISLPDFANTDVTHDEVTADIAQGSITELVDPVASVVVPMADLVPPADPLIDIAKGLENAAAEDLDSLFLTEPKPVPAAEPVATFDPAIFEGMLSDYARVEALEGFQAALKDMDGRVQAMSDEIVERDERILQLEGQLQNVTAMAQRAETLALAQNEVLVEFVRVQEKVDMAETFIVDLSRRLSAMETIDPADRVMVERALEDFNTRIEGMARDVGLVARLAINGSPDKVRSTSNAQPVGAGGDTVYTSTELQATAPGVSASVPADVKVGDFVEGYGTVLQILPAFDNSRVVVMENKSVILPQ